MPSFRKRADVRNSDVWSVRTSARFPHFVEANLLHLLEKISPFCWGKFPQNHTVLTLWTFLFLGGPHEVCGEMSPVVKCAFPSGARSDSSLLNAPPPGNTLHGKVRYSLDPSPCTLHPTPYTLQPTPHTLHPTPYTLHPRPTTYTIHPTPYTLHSTPYTLHPTPSPYSLHPAPLTLHSSPYTLHPTPYDLDPPSSCTQHSTPYIRNPQPLALAQPRLRGH